MGVYEKLAQVQGELNVPKENVNKFGGYNYRSCEDILEKAKPLCVSHGLLLTISDDIRMVSDRIYVLATATVTDTESGEQVSVNGFAREPLDKKGSDASQITGAASSYARKYALNGLFCIDDTKDADALNTSKEYTQPSQQTQAAAQPQPTVKQAVQQKQLVGEAQYKGEIGACATMDALMAIWNKYPQLQGDKGFRDAWASRRSQIEKK